MIREIGALVCLGINVLNFLKDVLICSKDVLKIPNSILGKGMTSNHF